MGLQLPKYAQEIFEDSPLEEVICQLRFNQILKIAASPPADFQDRIRKEFPIFTEERGIELSLAGKQPFFATTSDPAWQFKTSDERWTVSLTSTFVALKTTAYHDFDDFLKRLLPVVKACEVTYDPPFYTRVGLRYVNRLVMECKEGKRAPWEELLNSHLAGAFADPVLRDGIVEAQHHLVLDSDDGQIGWRYSRDVGQAEGRAAERFSLDFDHYMAGQVSRDDVPNRLTRFNETIYRLFRWCLTDKGYRWLKPKPKEGGAS